MTTTDNPIPRRSFAAALSAVLGGLFAGRAVHAADPLTGVEPMRLRTATLREYRATVGRIDAEPLRKRIEIMVETGPAREQLAAFNAELDEAMVKLAAFRAEMDEFMARRRGGFSS